MGSSTDSEERGFPERAGLTPRTARILLPLGAAAGAVAAGLGAFRGPAMLRNASPPGSAPPARPRPRPTAMEMGANVDGVLYYAGERFFVDRMRSADRWATNRSDTGEAAWMNEVPGARFDPNGWPSGVPAGHRQVRTIIQTHHPEQGSGIRYHVEWENASGLAVNGAVENKGGNAATVIPIDNPAGFTTLSFEQVAPGFRVRVCREDQRDLLKAGVVFNPESVARWSPYSVVRVMNWGPTNASEVSDWADRTAASSCSYRSGPGGPGVPLEVMVDFANAVDCDLWYCLPALASDEFVGEAAELIRARLRPGRRLYLELSNEVWNSAMFPAYGQYQSRAAELLGAGVWNGLEYHGYRAAQVSALAARRFAEAGQRERLVNVFGCQSVYMGALATRLAYATWPGGSPKGSAAQLPPTGATRIADAFDAYAVAPYSGGMLTATFNTPASQKSFVLECVRGGEAGFRRAFAQWEAGSQNLGLTGGPSPGRPANPGEDETIPGVVAMIRQWRDRADADSLRLVSYEGNLIVLSRANAWAASAPEVGAWTKALHARPEMEGLMERSARAYAAAGLELYTVYNHCNYSSGTAADESGFFGLLLYETQPDTPRYRAVKALAAKPARIAEVGA